MSFIVKTVTTKKEKILFTEFPNKLFKHEKAFVPALSMDEMNVFEPHINPAHEYCESIRFLAYKDNVIVGRIAGIINHQYNEAFKTNIVRFTRLDMIDDVEVTKVLLDAVATWGRSKNMTEMIGPIGFTDMDRMGMLVLGYEHLGSFITAWNPEYYHIHLEKLNLVKDVDWIESRIMWPKTVPEKVERGAAIVRKRFGYKLVKLKNLKNLNTYIYDAFDVYNKAFEELYGFYPVSRKVMDYYIKQLKSLVRLDFLWFVTDKVDKVVGFGLMMPSLSMAVKKSNGRLFPFGWMRFLRSIHKFNVIDFYFIAVDPNNQGHGVLSLIMEDGIKNGIKHGVIYAETGPELELNTKIQSQWKDYEPKMHKKRRCYKISIS